MKSSHVSVSRKAATVVAAFLLLVMFRMNAGSQALQAVALESGKPIERTFESGEPHAFQIKLRAGQFMHVEVKSQFGLDLLVSLFAPDGKQLIDMNAENGYLWFEDLSCVAEVDGAYRVEVKPLALSAIVNRYTLTVNTVREATERDRQQVSAEHAFSEARRMYLKDGTPLVDVVARYHAALSKWLVIGDKHWEAVTLTKNTV